MSIIERISLEFDRHERLVIHHAHMVHTLGKYQRHDESAERVQEIRNSRAELLELVLRLNKKDK